MKVLATVALLGTLILNVMNHYPAKANADYDYYDNEPVYPHQEHRLCDSRHCENTCVTPNAEDKPCPFRLCHEGYFCESGYVRDLETDQCILLSDCRTKGDSNDFQHFFIDCDESSKDCKSFNIQ